MRSRRFGRFTTVALAALATAAAMTMAATASAATPTATASPPYPCAATGGPNADAAAIGWLGNAQGATACLGGSFYVPNGINTEYGFGVVQLHPDHLDELRRLSARPGHQLYR